MNEIDKKSTPKKNFNEPSRWTSYYYKEDKKNKENSEVVSFTFDRKAFDRELHAKKDKELDSNARYLCSFIGRCNNENCKFVHPIRCKSNSLCEGKYCRYFHEGRETRTDWVSHFVDKFKYDYSTFFDDSE